MVSIRDQARETWLYIFSGSCNYKLSSIFSFVILFLFLCWTCIFVFDHRDSCSFKLSLHVPDVTTAICYSSHLILTRHKKISHQANKNFEDANRIGVV